MEKCARCAKKMYTREWKNEVQKEKEQFFCSDARPNPTRGLDIGMRMTSSVKTEMAAVQEEARCVF